MANCDEESKSDGLQILSVGTLYSGPWDKKYWSASRGKDRYPYPFGYQALRTHKGLTYKMEIYEGPKGPKFQITSNYKSGSGDTPDRAWENFQKCCSRNKLWHGKRFSGKVDGVEFFGFKNALVQRSLRELVATVNNASEQSSLCNNFNEASGKSPDKGCNMTDKCPDLVPYLGKNRVTGKRSRTCKGTDIKSAGKSSHGRCHPEQQDDDTKFLDTTPPKTCNDELRACRASLEDNDIGLAGGTLPVSSETELVKHVLPLAHASEAFDDFIVEPCLAQVKRELLSMETRTSASVANLDTPQEEKPLDRQCIEVQQHGYPVATEEKNEKAQVISDFLDTRPPVMNDSQGNYCGDLCAPDTLDTQQEITSPPDSGNQRVENSMVRNGPATADMITSEGLTSGSHSEEANYYLHGNSEKSDFDSVGEEVAKSMMTVLLPRAVPLLTYSSRKKKRKNKASKGSHCGQKLENESKGTVPSADVMSPVAALADSSLGGPTNEHIPGVYIDEATPLLENIRYVVPDSLDDQFEGHETNQLLSCTDNAEPVASDSQKEKHEPGRKGSSVEVDASETFYCHNQTVGFMEILSHKEEQKGLDEKPQKYCLPALHRSVGGAFSIPLDLITRSKDGCLIADDGFKSLEICSKRTELEDAPSCEGVKFISLSGKQQSRPCDAPQDASLVAAPLMEKHSASFLESIICRSAGDNVLSETFYAAGNMVAADSFQLTSLDDGDCSKTSFGVEGGFGLPVPFLQNEENLETSAPDSSDHILQDPALDFTFEKTAIESIGGNLNVGNSEPCIDQDTTGNQHCESVNYPLDQARSSSPNCVSHVSERRDDVQENSLQKQKDSDEVDKTWKLIGCYSHPVQISSVILTTKSDDIYICVSCGLPEDRKRDLFLYKIDAKEPSLGSPYMVAHTSMHLPVLKDEFGRQVAVDKTGLQFTPDATGLVVVDSIRTPYCREKNICCLCPECESCCFEENAIKIVQVKLGYVLVVLKLKTIHPLHFVLVCEPDHVIALDESGIIYVWVMNPTWSIQSEEYVIPSYEFLPSRIVELKRIPQSASIVVGHNGYGEFSLWDINKRNVLSRFSAPTNSVLEFVPVSLFSWHNKTLQSHNRPGKEELVKQLVEATMSWLSGHNEANMSCQMEGDEVAVWLFISTSDSRVQSYSSSYHKGPDGCWRLGLLIENKIILGVAVPPSTTAIGTAAGHGIIGTDTGRVYIWELAAATKLRTLHDFAGGGISHIVTDDSTTSAVAIAREAQLCVYLRT